jgi:hypothetical protein
MNDITMEREPVDPDDDDAMFVFDAIEQDPVRCGFRQTTREQDKPRLLVVRKDAARWRKLLYDRE